jgi:hypothetical protein
VHACPDSVVGRRWRLRGGDLGQVADRHGAALAGAEVIERLAVRDRQHPRARVARLHARIGTQRRQEGLLEGVVGRVAAHGRHEKAPHVVAVRIEEALKRLLGHVITTPQGPIS